VRAVAPGCRRRRAWSRRWRPPPSARGPESPRAELLRVEPHQDRRELRREHTRAYGALGVREPAHQLRRGLARRVEPHDELGSAPAKAVAERDESALESVGLRRHGRSTTRATASPPPIHSVASPRRWPRSSSAYSK